MLVVSNGPDPVVQEMPMPPFHEVSTANSFHLLLVALYTSTFVCTLSTFFMFFGSHPPTTRR